MNWFQMQDVYSACSSIPLDQLHHFSLGVLSEFAKGQLTVGDFLRWFSMPDSSYIPSAECIIKTLINSRAV